MANIFIKTFGCSVNQADSETMAGILKQTDFAIVDDVDDAELVIINTCTVKGPTDTNFFKYLDEMKEKDKKIVVAGCIPQTQPETLEDVSMIGTSQIPNIAAVVEETLNGNTVTLIVEEKNERLNLPRIRRNPIVEIIPICSGCLGEPCSYCIVKKARGELVSYAKEAIIERARKAVVQGAKEVWITAQDTGAYGKDIGTNLVELLKALIEVRGNFRIRLGMANPNHVIEFLDELIEVYKSPKMFKFLHIPVQSGNNEILEKMKRKYTVEDFLKIVDRFRAKIPDITISTDIICGFPGETEEQSHDSLDLIRKVMPDVLNISKFWARPGTEAAEMNDQIAGLEIKKRSMILTEVFNNIGRIKNERWLDWEGEVMIDEPGKEGTMIGRNYAYKQVIVPGKHDLGEVVKVKVKKITSYDLRA